MKKIALLAATLLMGLGAFAQETWFCSTPGKVLTYANKTGAGKTNDYYKYYIKGSSTEDEKTTVSFDVVIESIKGVAQQPVGCNVWTTEGYFHTNARAMMGQYGPGLSVKGHGPIIPENPTVGEDLGDCGISIESLGTTGKYTNVRFTGQEEIETPAGTFLCWVLEYDYASEVNFIMKLKQNGTCKMWMKKGIGVVKNVLYDKKGNKTLIQELIKIE
ncbi:MAG: hypothetical protein IJ855_00520 [Bacteroidales bacterium]|nr:hypothetical protein [Bacteroidales bacterium]